MLTMDDAGVGPHLVHFYGADEELAASVSQFLAAGLYGGDGTVVIARPARIAAFTAALRAEGIDVDRGLATGSVIARDADEVLAEFMIAGRADPRRFAHAVAAPLRAAGEGRPGMRIYGEMVALLWERGEVTAALELEELWNDLLADPSFTSVLYCAYPSTLEVPEHAASFEAACRLHSAVLRGGGAAAHASTYAHFEPTLHAPSAARTFVARTLGGAEAHDLVESAVLVVSELATNAVVHARSPFTVAVSRLPGSVRISVRDDSPALPAARDPRTARAGGRGLAIVARLTREWRSSTFADGKVVWAELDRPGSTA
ncbi:MAG: MEDS domain-containing protein [Acidimicrobiales bacterium]